MDNVSCNVSVCLYCCSQKSKTGLMEEPKKVERNPIEHKAYDKK